MKLVQKLGILLCFALLASTAAATTENKEMPTEKEVTAFIDGFKASGDFANSAYDAFIEQYPAGHCDLWSNGMISFYFYDPDSPKEYGSIYLDSNGEKVKPGCNAGATPVKSYTGEPEVKEDTEEEDKEVSEEKEEIEEENKETVKEDVSEDEEKEDVKEDKRRITKKITSVLIRYNNGDIDAEELGNRIDMILGEE